MRTILVTGTRKGLGKAIADHYLDKGDIVIGFSRREYKNEHSNYYHRCIDITDEKAVIATIKDISRVHGPIEILINNAGIASMNHCSLVPGKTLDKVFGTNVFGTFYCLREVTKLMIRQRYGRVINFTSVAVPLSIEGEAVYAASKAAVEALTKITAKELAVFNITINAIGPCPIDTDLIKGLPKGKVEKLIQQQAIKRMGRNNDVLNVIDFFIQKESNFITGQTLYLGGVSG